MVNLDEKLYYKYFKNVEEGTKRKILGGETIKNIGEALKVYRESAIAQFIKTPFATVKLPSGMSIKPLMNWRNPTRVKWRSKIPDGTRGKDCLEIINKVLGSLDRVGPATGRSRRMEGKDEMQHISNVMR